MKQHWIICLGQSTVFENYKSVFFGEREKNLTHLLFIYFYKLKCKSSG